MPSRIITITRDGSEEVTKADSPAKTNACATRLARTLCGGDVLALSGDLGSGKTTFTQCLARALGVRQYITSPTFVLMKLYPLPKPLRGIEQICHIDTYRLSSAAELVAIGAEEYIGVDTTLTVVEWPEKVKKLFPRHTIWISFAFNGTV